MTTAIYALSADPITNGHLDVIKRSSKMFDHVIVAIGFNPKKKYTFSIKERILFAKNAVAIEKLNNVSIEEFNTSLAAFAFKKGASVLIRGIRNIKDFQEEQDLANINKNIYPELETVFLLSNDSNCFVSSSAVKELTVNNLNTSFYASPMVRAHLHKKINNRIFVGVTGLMGSGKSYVSEKLADFSKDKDIPFLNLDLDILCHQVFDVQNPSFETQRNQIINTFGSLERDNISKIVFNNPYMLQKLNDIFENVINMQITIHSDNFQGVVLINGATLIENNLIEHLCYNQIVMIDTPKNTRFKRCFSGRNIDPDVVALRDTAMLDTDKRYDIVNQKIKDSNFGFVISFNNENSSLNDIKALYNKITESISSTYK